MLTKIISLGETFSDSIALKVINIFDEGAAVQISTVFGTIYHVDLFLKYLKLNIDFKNWENKSEKPFSFLDNLI